MKKRTSFVSNSSSASFCIPRHLLTDAQIQSILNHAASEYFKKGGPEEDDFACSPYDAWHIEVTNNCVKGYTSMDNFNMPKYLISLGIDPCSIHVDGGNYDEGEWGCGR